MRRGLFRSAGAIAVAAVLVFAGAFAAPAAAAPSSERVSGADRYATAAAVSKSAYPTPGTAATVVLVSGESFADALSAGPVAHKLGGPLLLTRTAALPGATATELTRLAPARVVIMGGNSAVSAAVEATVRAIVPDTVRVAGVNRYETSMAAVRAAFPDGASHAYIATGRTFPDALTGGALAAVQAAPLIIVPGTDSVAGADVVQLLDDLGVTAVTVLGGEGAVTTSLAAGLSSPARTIERIGGPDRYAVAAAVASRFPAGGTSLLVASGLDYPDALAATALSARRLAPVLLTRPVCADATVRSYVSGHAPATLTLIGGAGAVRGLVGSLHPCLSTASPSSPWVMVNKLNPLRPASYVPGDLRRVGLSGGYHMRAEAASALERMSAASTTAGAGALGVASGYRSYATQTSIYNNHVRSRGRAQADVVSARPGHSEHQTGLAADVVACGSGCSSIDAFAGTAQGRWVAANAHRYGFIVRYEPGRTSITGYASEPWHLRYVGVALATDYKAGGFHTLEQYLGYPAAPHY